MTHPYATSPDTAPLAAEILRRHGLRQQPFAAKATERFIYCDPALDMPVGVLLQRLQTDAKPLLLVGERGVGKSTQLLQLLSRGTAALTFCAFKGRTGATFASIEHAIRQQWGQVAAGQGAHAAGEDAPAKQAPEKNSLAMILLSVARRDRRPVLMLDDAHLLAPAVLGALLRLRREVNRHNDNTMGIVLAGEPALNELAANAHGSEAPAEPFTLIRLRPLMESQTVAYLRHRLQAAGASDPDLLSGEIAQAIHRESGGLPADVNQAANRHLEKLAPEPSAGAADRLPGIPMNAVAQGGSYWVVPAAAGAFGVLIGALLASLFFLSEGRVATPDQALQVQRTAPVDAREEPEPLWVPSGQEAPEALESATMSPPVVGAAPVPQPLPEPRFPSLPEVLEDDQVMPGYALVSAPAPSGTGPSQPDTHNPAAPSSEPGSGEAPPAGHTMTALLDDPAVAAEQSAAPDTKPPLANPEPAVFPGQPREAALAPVKPPAPDAPHTVTQETQTVVSAPAAEVSQAAVPAGQRGPDWVRERPPGQFTIQIIAGDDLEALHRFARRVSMEADVAWFRTRRGDQDWYALVTGEYPDMASAQAAAARFPAPVRRNQPWIRTFGSIQNAMDPPS
jgi:DamX protein